MLNILRPKVFLKISRCSSRQIFSGCAGSLNYLSSRTLYDADKTALNNSSKNAVVLKARYCTPPPGPEKACPPNSGGDEPKSSNWKRLLGVLGLGVGAGVLYFWQSRNKGKGPDNEGIDPSLLLLQRQRIPLEAKDIPKDVPYLLIGGGTASFSAFRAIKSHDPKAKVLVVSNEFDKPYMRPPLSKELWYHAQPGVVPENYKFQQWNGAQRSLFYEPDEFYMDPTKLMENPNGGVAVVQGYTVKKVDVCQKKAILTDGTEIAYNECLIATGCSPKNLDVFEAAPLNIKERITTFRTTDDYLELKKLSETKKSIAIIGSGFLGSELSCALSKYGENKDLKVYQVFFESGNMAKVLPEYLSKWTTNKVQEQGVCVVPYAQVDGVSLQGNRVKLSLSNGQSILTDHVVVCVGCEPNTELARTSGLETDGKYGGFLVNAELEARRHLYVAGDAASFYDPLLGRRRVEHHDNSVISGRLAGENMVGLKKPYTHQSMFWSDLGPNIGYEGIGIIDSALPTVGVFAKSSPGDERNKDVRLEEVSLEQKDCKTNNNQSAEHEKTTDDTDNYDKGVIFYMRDDKIVGVLLWNIFNRINIARKVINENKKFDDLNEVAKLFEIHS